MRTTWNGSLTFGLVSIPVGLAPATKPAARQSDVSFRLLHRECLTPIKQKRWCPKHDREVAPGRDRQGLGGVEGPVRVVEEAELEALEAHDDSRSIEISRFVPLEEVDPIWRRPHLLPRPRRDAGAAPAVPAAARGDARTGRGAIGRFVRSGRESLCLVRAAGDALVLETLYLAEDVYSEAEIDEAVEDDRGEEARARARAPDHRRPRGPFDPNALTSAYRRDLRALLEAKLRRGRARRARPSRGAGSRRSTCSRRSRRASRRRRASSARPKKAARPARQAAKRPARKAARK